MPLLLRSSLLVAALAAATSAALAQDPVFSQYTANPVYNNPGLAGLFEGELRLSASYREQWRSILDADAHRTYAAAAELRTRLGGRDFLVSTVNAYRDVSGAARYTQSGAGLGLGLQKYLGGGRGRHADYLGFGARAGYGERGLDPSGLWFSSDLDTATLAIASDGSRTQGVGNRAFLDLSAGVNYALVRRAYSLTVGLAGHHVNWPNASVLLSGSRRLKPRIAGLIAGEVLLAGGLRVLPSALVEVQGQSRRATAGAGVLYTGDERGDRGFRFGTYARVGNSGVEAAALEAIVLAAQLELERVTVGLSYDVNTAAIGRAVDARGAYELSISYTRAKRSRYRLVCPKL